MFKKFLCFLIVCSLLLSCVCCSSSSSSDEPAASEDSKVDTFSLCDIKYSVPSSWSSFPDESDPDAPLSHSSHTSRTADIDFVIDRYRLDYEGPWSYAQEDPDLETEVLFEADYDTNGVSYPGYWYKADGGSFVYIYELTYDEAYYRLTFTLQNNSDDLVNQMHAILDSVYSA